MNKMLCLFTFATAICFADAEQTKAPITKGVAVVHATDGNKVSGVVSFTTVPGGVRIVADINNLKAGNHGFHVHEHGDCSAHDASSAGGHFNPTGTKHGGPGTVERHVGDMGNLEANEQGYAHYDRIDDLIQLDGENSIIGRSVVIHADEDDLTSQPTGNSGARVACGIIN